MGPDCTIDLVMVCDQSMERCMNENLLLCPPKSSDVPPMKSPPRPLSITLPPQNATMLPFQPQSLLQPKVPPQVQLEAPCLGKRPYGSSTDVSTGQLEVTLRQVYSTRRYTRFVSRAAPLIPLASVGGESSSQGLPSIGTDAPLMPPKKKTRTFYSTDQLEELERVFQDDHYPDGDKRKEIAAAIGVTPQRIMVWFQNRRAKWRKTAKATGKKPPASRGQPCVQANRPPIFSAPAVTSQHAKTGNTLPPYSTIRTSCTSPPGGFLEYMPPPMHSPPPIRRASLPLITAYNPPTHTVSLLLDTPEHSEPSSADTTPLSLQTDTGFDYDGLGSSVKLDYMTSASQNSTFQLNTFPQQSNSLLQQTNSLLPQQTNTLLSQQSSCLMPQQSSTILPQYSHLSYLTPSPYLTPNPTESSSAPYLPLTSGNNTTLPAYTSSGHAYLQSQTNNQMLLQSGMHVDISTDILMLVLMSISAVMVLFCKRKGPMFVLPFVLMMFAELSLSFLYITKGFLSLYDGSRGLPGTLLYKNMLEAAKSSLKVERLNEEQIGYITMCHSVAIMLYILLKVYALQVSMRCFYALKAERMVAISVDTGNTVTVKLPSYDEALKIKAEGAPPTYNAA
ncbi:hypothetical protein QQF64_014146 [Cirrhinus molitorella]|uniref:Homeobox domain-containing protein n=1 Tax=Cirrhinus molitorella TaxID=172907 RepID=A0ABR3LT62_9TELE